MKTIPYFPAKLQPNRQTGFSLVELMVALTIGLLMVAGVLSLFLNTSLTNAEMARANNLIENGRFAIQLLEKDIAHAGFWGTHIPDFDNLVFTGTPNDAPKAVPDPCLDYASWTDASETEPSQYKKNLVGIPLQSYEIASPVPSPALPVCSAIVTSPKANTDVLFVRHAETCLPGQGHCEAFDANKVYFQASTLPSTCLPPMNASMPAIAGMPATDVVFDLSKDTSVVLHKRDTQDVGSCTISTATPSTTPAADKRKFVSNLYYLRDFAETAGDGIPTLVRSSFDGTSHQAAVALIEGIEGFRVELGIDNKSKTGAAVNASDIVWQDPETKRIPTNRGDGAPDEFIRCTTASPCTAEQLMNVTAVKIYVLARNREPSRGYTDTKTYQLGDTSLGPFNDHYKRHVFSTVVRLPNISGRRETP